MKKTTTLFAMALLAIPAAAQAANQPSTQSRDGQSPSSQSPGSQKKAPQKPAAPKPVELGQVYDGKEQVIALDGTRHRMRDLMNKVTVLNFYSTESASQRAAAKELFGLQRDFGKQGVTFLYIDSNLTEIGIEEPAETPATTPATSDAPKSRPYPRLDEKVAALPQPIRLFADHRNRLADRLLAKTTPHVFVFDPSRRLVYQGGLKAFRSTGGRFETTHFVRDVLTKLTTNERFDAFSTRAVGDRIKRAPGTMNLQPHTQFRDNDEQAKAAAIKQKKLMMVNFSGFNCSASRILESVVFDDPTAREIMRKHLVEARLHTDIQSQLTEQRFARNRKMMAELVDGKATPAVVVLDPATGKKLGTFRLSGAFPSWTGKWIQFVRKMLSAAGRPL